MSRLISHCEKHSSPGIALLEALGTTSTAECAAREDIVNLCSGKFPDTIPSPTHCRAPTPSESPPTPSSSSSDDEESSQITPSSPLTKADGTYCSEPAFLSNGEGLFDNSAILSEKRNLASQVFGEDKAAGHGGVVLGRDDDSDQDNAVWRWAKRCQGVAAKDGSSGSAHEVSGGAQEVTGNGGSGMFDHLDDEEDDDDASMPTIRRRKVIVHQNKV